jgi:YesN/AraC family two-component response regulator
MITLIQLLSCLHDLQKETEEPALRITTRSYRYSEMIMQWVEQHYTEEFNLEQLAEVLHLSKFYVSRVFRQETGESITDYMTARRVKQACRLLQNTSLSVEAIGCKVGLPNSSYFFQLFKRNIGMSPLQYRNSERY